MFDWDVDGNRVEHSADGSQRPDTVGNLYNGTIDHWDLQYLQLIRSAVCMVEPQRHGLRTASDEMEVEQSKLHDKVALQSVSFSCQGRATR